MIRGWGICFGVFTFILISFSVNATEISLLRQEVNELTELMAKASRSNAARAVRHRDLGPTRSRLLVLNYTILIEKLLSMQTEIDRGHAPSLDLGEKEIKDMITAFFTTVRELSPPRRRVDAFTRETLAVFSQSPMLFKEFAEAPLEEPHLRWKHRARSLLMFRVFDSSSSEPILAYEEGVSRQSLARELTTILAQKPTRLSPHDRRLAILAAYHLIAAGHLDLRLLAVLKAHAQGESDLQIQAWVARAASFFAQDEFETMAQLNEVQRRAETENPSDSSLRPLVGQAIRRMVSRQGARLEQTRFAHAYLNWHRQRECEMLFETIHRDSDESAGR